MNLLALLIASFPFITHQSSSSATWINAAVENEKQVLTLYYKAACPHSQKVLNYLRTIHRQVPLKNVEDDQAKAELRDLGDKMQVPCLVINGQPLYDSNEIIHWLSQHQNELELTDG